MRISTKVQEKQNKLAKRMLRLGVRKHSEVSKAIKRLTGSPIGKDWFNELYRLTVTKKPAKVVKSRKLSSKIPSTEAIVREIVRDELLKAFKAA